MSSNPHAGAEGIDRVIILNLDSEDEQSELKIIRLLSVLLSGDNSPEDKKSVLESEFGIAMTEEKEKELDVMCNLK